MSSCHVCGAANAETARFCNACGRQLIAATSVAGSRRTVTVVFSDLVGSTELAVALDTEALRAILGEYFALMRGIVERHGGHVEKFIGDAVVAAFGVHVAHEDDPLRAARAAFEMREALTGFNEEIGRHRAVSIQTRTGVNTGEVASGSPSDEPGSMTGPAVNLAARLEQAAPPGDILLGEATYRHIRDAVRVDEFGPLELKGFPGEQRAFRLIDVALGAVGQVRRLDSPLVGRDAKMVVLEERLARVSASNGCERVTIVGPPGIGKSRLVGEFLHRTASTTVQLTGRCLPYGEGITFWPIAELVKGAVGLRDSDPSDVAMDRLVRHLDGVDQGPVIAARVGGAVGLTKGTGAPEETFWAIRRFLEASAREGPLVVVFDDIHWGEPTFLDLLEHITARSTGVPLLLVCMARPEFLDDRPAWDGAPNTTTLRLEPLDPSMSEALVRNYLGGNLPAQVLQRISETSGGIPLFAEAVVSMLIDDGVLVRRDERWFLSKEPAQISIPPTLSGLLAARLDQLDPDDRAVLERASIIGRDFSPAEVEALLDDGADQLQARLGSLIDKELVRTSASSAAGGESHAFGHILIRDAAYESMPKATRADLHERYANWLEHRARTRIDEVEEIVAYHLERAYRLWMELGSLDERFLAIGRRAGAKLASAGHRAVGRGDVAASVNLLGRAVSMLPGDDPARGEAILELAESLIQADELERAAASIEELLGGASGSMDPNVVARARLAESAVRFLAEPMLTNVQELRSVATVAVEAFESAGEQTHLAAALEELAWTYWLTGETGRMQELSSRAMELARGSEDWVTFTDAADDVARSLVLGDVPCGVAAEALETMATQADHRMTEAAVRVSLAVVLAKMRQSGSARANLDLARGAFEDLGQLRWIAAADGARGLVSWWDGEFDEAERALRQSYEFSLQGEGAVWGMEASNLAQLLYDRDRIDDADEIADVISRGTPSYEMESQIEWRGVRAKVLARRGDQHAGIALALESVDLAARTEFLSLHAYSLLDLAECREAADDRGRATEAVERALGLFARKEDAVGAARAEGLLARLRA